MMGLIALDLAGVLYVCRNLRAADVRELEATRFGHHDPDALAVEVMQTWAATGHSWLVLNDGTPCAIFGATQPWPGFYSCYLIATDQFNAVALPLTKFVRRVFIPHMRAQANRIEARGITGHEAAAGWLRLLGAEVESVAKGYGRDGEDFQVWTLPRTRDADNVDS